MPFYPIRNDITRMEVDAIVNAANRSLLGGGGVDGAIHRAAGPGLLSECRTLGGCSTGDAKLTRGYDLPARYVIHTVGPIYRDGLHGEETLLRSCYRRSLEIAEANGCESVAFPLISAGAYGYPREEAIRIANEEITAFLKDRDMTVYLVFYDRDSYTAGRSRYPELVSRIEESRVRQPGRRRRLEEEEAGEGLADLSPLLFQSCESRASEDFDESAPGKTMRRESCAPAAPKPKALKSKSAVSYASAEGYAPKPGSLEDALRNRDESFSQMLLRLISASGMSDPECYHKANIDKKLFSKIRSKKDYQPSKATVLAFAVALQLDLQQTGIMLRRAGFALNGWDTFDIIVEYFISRGEYDLFKINEVLFSYDQTLLGNSER